MRRKLTPCQRKVGVHVCMFLFTHVLPGLPKHENALLQLLQGARQHVLQPPNGQHHEKSLGCEANERLKRLSVLIRRTSNGARAEGLNGA